MYFWRNTSEVLDFKTCCAAREYLFHNFIRHTLLVEKQHSIFEIHLSKHFSFINTKPFQHIWWAKKMINKGDNSFNYPYIPVNITVYNIYLTTVIPWLTQISRQPKNCVKKNSYYANHSTGGPLITLLKWSIRKPYYENIVVRFVPLVIDHNPGYNS